MITFPNSKINLGLNVVEKRPDGYHNLETVFYPVNLQDALEVTTAKVSDKEYTLHVSGTPVECSPEDNLVVKAYLLLKKDFKLPNVNIHMYKHIPSGAGLGGGSSDAAFMIKALNSKYHLNLTDDQMETYAATLGADCAFFIKDKPVFATGIGNEMELVDLSLKGYYILIVKPDIHVSTREAYSAIHPRYPDLSLKELIKRPIDTWKNSMVNDFEQSVFARHPEIGLLKEKIYGLGAVYASMTGSGSAIYGLFGQQIPELDGLFPGTFCRQRELD